MAQSLVFRRASSGGMFTNLKVAAVQLVNSAAEATYTVTPANFGMSAFIGVVAVDEGGQSAVQHTPTADATTGLLTQVALSFTAGRELSILAFGF
jgi:hypothetical protein